MSEIILAITHIFGKGKMQVPSEVRRMMGLKDGDNVIFFQGLDERIYLQKGRPPIKRLGKYRISET